MKRGGDGGQDGKAGTEFPVLKISRLPYRRFDRQYLDVKGVWNGARDSKRGSSVQVVCPAQKRGKDERE